MKYSFIIPAHNCEESVINTLDSICNDINDRYKDIVEIVVIENGSTDNTIKTINDFIKKSNRIVKLYTSPKGVSNARNTGIKKSKGEYLIFVDSDDIWLYGSIEVIMKESELNKDLYVYSFIKGKTSDQINNCKKIIHQFDSQSKEEIIKWIISKPTLRAQAWAKVYKKSIITENNILFNKELKYSEDSEFVLRYLKYANTINISSVPIYKYVLTEGSAMRKKNNERIEQYIKSMNCTIQEYENKNTYNDAINKYIACHLNIILVHDVFVYGNKYKECIEKYKCVKKEKIFIDSIKKIKLSDCLCKELIVELFIKFHLDLFVAILCYFKSFINNR